MILGRSNQADGKTMSRRQDSTSQRANRSTSGTGMSVFWRTSRNLRDGPVRSGRAALGDVGRDCVGGKGGADARIFEHRVAKSLHAVEVDGHPEIPSNGSQGINAGGNEEGGNTERAAQKRNLVEVFYSPHGMAFEEGGCGAEPARHDAEVLECEQRTLRTTSPDEALTARDAISSLRSRSTT